MKIQNFFTEAFYINLDARPDRREIFEKELKLCGLDTFVKRVSACVPNLEGIDPILDNGACTEVGYRKHGACGRSHRNIVEYAKQKNLNNVLIFEDDATFYNDGEIQGITLVEKALDTLSGIPDWDLIYFGALIVGDKIKVPVGNLLEVENVLTTHAWGINKKCYDYILKYRPNDGWEKEYDSPIDGCLGRHVDLKKYLVYPLAMYQREGILSDCDVRRDKQGKIFGVSTGEVEQWIRNYDKPFK